MNTADPILDEIIARLVPAYGQVNIYLFGSRARGTHRPDSDYDLLLVVPDQSPRECRTASRAYKALWGLGVPVDVIVWTESEFNKRLHIENSLPAQIVREGRLLNVA